VSLPEVQPWMVLGLSGVIFTIGLFGLVLRRNLLIMLMCIELMLNAVVLNFVTYSKINHHMTGEITAFFIIVVAAAESAVGLGLVIAFFRTLRSVDSDQMRTLKE